MTSEDINSQKLRSTRLLNRQEAAAYCAVSVPTFDRICPISPFALVKNNPRLFRFDKRDIDLWIESLKGLNDNRSISKSEILDRLV